MASRNKRPTNRYRVTYYPAGKPDGLTAGEATTIERAREIAEQWAPATIWDTWHRQTGPGGKRYYHPVLAGTAAKESD